MRVSEEELQELGSRCAAEGARSISDYLRSSVFERTVEAAPEASRRLLQRMRKQEQRLTVLAREIKRLASRLGESPGL
jgi:hypothetical protein